MGILAWIVFGFLVGLVARAVIPGRQKLGFITTTLVGVGGSFVGGTLGNMLFHYKLFALGSAGFVGSVVGAVLLMLAFGLARDRA